MLGLRLRILLLSLLSILGCKMLSAQEQQKIHILGFGSSFMEDMLYRVPEIFPDDTAALDLNFLCISGGSLDDHWKLISNDQPNYIFFHYDNDASLWTTDTLSYSQVIDQKKWDIFILQQNAQYSGRYPTIRSTLNTVLTLLENRFPQAQFYWHSSWAFAKDSDHPGFSFYDHDQHYMFRKIIECGYNIMMKDFKGRFDGIIPTGIVLQSLRDDTNIITPKDFTRDGFHLDLGIGRFAAACTFYESVLSERLGHSIMEQSLNSIDDSVHTSTDYDLIRETCCKVIHNDSLILQLLANDIVYKSLFYGVDGKLLGSTPGRRPFVQRDFYLSGRKEGSLIIHFEE